MKMTAFLRTAIRLKLISLLFVAGMLYNSTVQAQEHVDDIKSKSGVPYRAMISHHNRQYTEGWLYRATEDSIYLLPLQVKGLKMKKTVTPDFLAGRWGMPAESIGSLKLQRRNAVLRGALFGLLTGAITGAVIGFAQGDDPVMEMPNDPVGIIVASVNNAFTMTAGEKATMNGLGLGVLGAGIGAVVGTFKFKVDIGGQKAAYKESLANIRKRALAQ